MVNCLGGSEAFGTCLRGKIADAGLLSQPAEPLDIAATAEKGTPASGTDGGGTGEASPAEAEAAAPAAPEFGLLRAEPDGSVVIAGSGAPGQELQIFANGTLLGSTIVESSGDWVYVPEQPLAPGGVELTLGAAGSPEVAARSFVVVIDPDRTSEPLVVASVPGQASNILQGIARPTQQVAAVEDEPAEPETDRADALPATGENGDTATANADTAPAEAQGSSEGKGATPSQDTAPVEEGPPLEDETPAEDVAEDEGTGTEQAALPDVGPADAGETVPSEDAAIPAENTETPASNPVESDSEAEGTEPVPTGSGSEQISVAEGEASDQPAEEQELANVDPEVIAAPEVATVQPSIDAIEIDGTRNFFAGSGADGATLRLYVDDVFVADATVEGGRWLVESEAILDKPSQRVRVDMLAGASAEVVARAEVNFVIDVPIEAEERAPIVIAQNEVPAEEPGSDGSGEAEAQATEPAGDRTAGAGTPTDLVGEETTTADELVAEEAVTEPVPEPEPEPEASAGSLPATEALPETQAETEALPEALPQTEGAPETQAESATETQAGEQVAAEGTGAQELTPEPGTDDAESGGAPQSETPATSDRPAEEATEQAAIDANTPAGTQRPVEPLPPVAVTDGPAQPVPDIEAEVDTPEPEPEPETAAVPESSLALPELDERSPVESGAVERLAPSSTGAERSPEETAGQTAVEPQPDSVEADGQPGESASDVGAGATQPAEGATSPATEATLSAETEAGTTELPGEQAPQTELTEEADPTEEDASAIVLPDQSTVPDPEPTGPSEGIAAGPEETAEPVNDQGGSGPVPGAGETAPDETEIADLRLSGEEAAPQEALPSPADDAGQEPGDEPAVAEEGTESPPGTESEAVAPETDPRAQEDVAPTPSEEALGPAETDETEIVEGGEAIAEPQPTGDGTAVSREPGPDLDASQQADTAADVTGPGAEAPAEEDAIAPVPESRSDSGPEGQVPADEQASGTEPIGEPADDASGEQDVPAQEEPAIGEPALEAPAPEEEPAQEEEPALDEPAEQQPVQEQPADQQPAQEESVQDRPEQPLDDVAAQPDEPSAIAEGEAATERAPQGDSTDAGSAQVSIAADDASEEGEVPTLTAVAVGDPEDGRFASGKAIIRRGDNLWTIARRVYGEGIKYTTIYEANSTQIRNPARIYPGQVFELPQEPGASQP